MQAYARCDTHYLLHAYDCLKRELRAADAAGAQVPTTYTIALSAHAIPGGVCLDAGCRGADGGPHPAAGPLFATVLERSRQICLQLYKKQLLTTTSHEEAAARWGVSGLSPRQAAAFAALYAWRDTLARSLDESTGYVLPRGQLCELARVLPTSATEVRLLLGPHGASPALARAEQIADVIMRAQQQQWQDANVAGQHQHDEEQPRQPFDSAYAALLSAAGAAVNASRNAAAGIRAAPNLAAKHVAPLCMRRPGKVGNMRLDATSAAPKVQSALQPILGGSATVSQPSPTPTRLAVAATKVPSPPLPSATSAATGVHAVAPAAAVPSASLAAPVAAVASAVAREHLGRSSVTAAVVVGGLQMHGSGMAALLRKHGSRAQPPQPAPEPQQHLGHMGSVQPQQQRRVVSHVCTSFAVPFMAAGAMHSLSQQQQHQQQAGNTITAGPGCEGSGADCQAVAARTVQVAVDTQPAAPQTLLAANAVQAEQPGGEVAVEGWQGDEEEGFIPLPLAVNRGPQQKRKHGGAAIGDDPELPGQHAHKAARTRDGGHGVHHSTSADGSNRDDFNTQQNAKRRHRQLFDDVGLADDAIGSDGDSSDSEHEELKGITRELAAAPSMGRWHQQSSDHTLNEGVVKGVIGAQSQFTRGRQEREPGRGRGKGQARGGMRTTALQAAAASLAVVRHGRTAVNPFEIPDTHALPGGKRSAVAPRTGNKSATFK